MKKLWTSVVVASATLCANIYGFCVHNNTADTFDIAGYANDYRITMYYDDSNCQELGKATLFGNTKVSFRVRAISCEPKKTDERPFIYLKNEQAEFQEIFLDTKYAILNSSTAIELHNDVVKDSYDHEYIGDFGSQYIGRIINWMIVGPYRVVYFYEKHGRGKCCVIEYVTDDNSWLRKIEEDDYKCRTGEISYLPRPARPPRTKRHWWSKLCSCSDCDD
jgi:hypothetical protein